MTKHVQSSTSGFYIKQLLDRALPVAFFTQFYSMSPEEYDAIVALNMRRVIEELEAPSMPHIPESHKDVAYAIWNALIEACDAYFLQGVSYWSGDDRAPEFTDKQVTDQFNHWSDYQLDAGAMNWRDNSSKEFHFDFNALPDAWKRAVCERVWIICKEGKLDESKEYMDEMEKYTQRYGSS
mgnify:FL=1